MTPDRHADETAVRALLDRATTAWAAGDARAYAAVFAPDADYITFMGTHHKGRSAIEVVHVPLFEKYQKGSRTDGEITQVRFLAPDVALVHGRGALVKGRRRRTARNTKVQTWVVVRRNGEWEIAAFHNTKYSWILAPLTAKLDARMASSALPPVAIAG
ncbi:SgcJ/EcaC family oxidoreductase [Nocardia terpenica]|uniref:SgcJ/EcaC family oxidoreductase n=1 Tax=Nocardia terpenica TaxID=455432 RepID=UPI002FE3912E